MLTLVGESLNSCTGCEISLLNYGEPLLALLPQLDIRHFPVLMDHKYHAKNGRNKAIHIPEARVGLVSGGVRNSEHLEVLEQVRKKVDILIALGTCATSGGLPALANLFSTEDIIASSFKDAPSCGSKELPDPETQAIPTLRSKCTPLSAHVAVDIVVPGCPPHPDWIIEALSAVLENRSPVWPDRCVCSVCPACPAKKAQKPFNQAPLRNLRAPVIDPEAPLSSMQCLLLQGFICLGPVTRAGCGGRDGIPLCISGRSSCRGCYGPARPNSVPYLDFIEALAVAEHNPALMLDKPGYLSRFTGALEQPLKEQP